MSTSKGESKILVCTDKVLKALSSSQCLHSIGHIVDCMIAYNQHISIKQLEDQLVGHLQEFGSTLVADELLRDLRFSSRTADQKYMLFTLPRVVKAQLYCIFQTVYLNIKLEFNSAEVKNFLTSSKKSHPIKVSQTKTLPRSSIVSMMSRQFRQSFLDNVFYAQVQRKMMERLNSGGASSSSTSTGGDRSCNIVVDASDPGQSSTSLVSDDGGPNRRSSNTSYQGQSVFRGGTSSNSASVADLSDGSSSNNDMGEDGPYSEQVTVVDASGNKTKKHTLCWTEPLDESCEPNGLSGKELSLYYVVPEPHFIEFLQTVNDEIAKARVAQVEDQNDALSGFITRLDAATQKAMKATYFKWGYSTESPSKFQERPQTYLPAPGVKQNVVVNLPSELKHVLHDRKISVNTGKSFENWCGFILAYHDFVLKQSIKKQTVKSTKGGEFYKSSNANLNIAGSTAFFDRVLLAVSTASKTLIQDWLACETQNYISIQNYILFKSWDSIAKEKDREVLISIPSGYIKKFITDILAAAPAPAPALQLNSNEDISSISYYITPGLQVELQHSAEFEQELRFDQTNSPKILILGLENINIIEEFISLTIEQLPACQQPIFTIVDMKPRSIKAAQCRFSRLFDDIDMHFITAIFEEIQFDTTFDCFFSLISGRITSLMLLKMLAIRKNSKTIFLLTQEASSQFCSSPMNCKLNGGNLFWSVHEPEKAFDSNDSCLLQVHNQSRRKRKALKPASIEDEAVESDRDSGASDESSEETAAGKDEYINEFTGNNRTTYIKQVLFFRVSTNLVTLSTIKFSSAIIDHYWRASADCIPFRSFLNFEDHIIVRLFSFELKIPLRYSFEIFVSRNSRARRNIHNLKLDDEKIKLMQMFIGVSAIIYDFVRQRLPCQVEMKEKTIYCDDKMDEIKVYLKKQNILSNKFKCDSVRASYDPTLETTIFECVKHIR